MSLIPRKEKAEKNRPPPPNSYSIRAAAASDKKEHRHRKVRNVTTAADCAELERHYTFLPSRTETSTWQERMVKHYHSQLYKEYVLADLTRPGQVGLRWRTQAEVQQGKGHETCGNKHCPSYKRDFITEQQKQQLALYYHETKSLPLSQQEEMQLLKRVPHGLGLYDYEVNFKYVEGGEQKNELVKLRLCLQCAPLLFHNKGGALGARRARHAPQERNKQEETSLDEGQTKRKSEGDKRVSTGSFSDDEVSDQELQRKRRRKHRKRKKHKKRRRNKNRDYAISSSCDDRKSSSKIKAHEA